MQERDDKRGKNLHEHPMVRVSGRQDARGLRLRIAGVGGISDSGRKGWQRGLHMMLTWRNQTAFSIKEEGWLRMSQALSCITSGS